MKNGHWAVRLGECERCKITHRVQETVTVSAGRAPAGQFSNVISHIDLVVIHFTHIVILNKKAANISDRDRNHPFLDDRGRLLHLCLGLTTTETAKNH